MSCTTQANEVKTKNQETSFALEVKNTTRKCPAGEKVSSQNIADSKIPVLSCEGACIRGEIARLAANLISKEEKYRRACHGELLAVPQSTMYKWILDAEKVVLIDGCFLHCHGRIIENLVRPDQLIVFDALSKYKKYTNRFDIDSVPEAERIEVAREVADWILEKLSDQGQNCCGGH